MRQGASPQRARGRRGPALTRPFSSLPPWVERDAVAELGDKISDPYLKKRLELVSSTLDLVEMGCLDKKVMAEPRSRSALGWWLGQTSNFLNAAIQQRKDVEDIVTKFGANVRSFGN
jgi:hypothetical protein